MLLYGIFLRTKEEIWTDTTSSFQNTQNKFKYINFYKLKIFFKKLKDLLNLNFKNCFYKFLG